MRTRRRAFALIIVLLAVGAVFAIALRSAVVARTTVVEADSMSLRAEALRDGRSAVVLVLRGLTATDTEAVAAAERLASGGGLGRGGGAEDDEDTTPELPAFLKELIEGLERVEDEAEEAAQEQQDRRARAAAAVGVDSPTARRTVDALGLPREPVGVELGGRVYRVRMKDAAATLGVNSADERMLLAYFDAIGVDGGIARSLTDQWLDWIDEDSSARSYGAEDAAYAREGMSARDGNVLALEELLALPAMTDEVFARLREDWSVSALGRVHVGSASRAVLSSMEGSSVEIASAIVSARERGELSAEVLKGLMPAIDGGELLKRLTLSSSGIVRVWVDVEDASSGATIARMHGAAVLGRDGVGAVELAIE